MVHYIIGIVIAGLFWVTSWAGTREDVLSHIPPELAKLSTGMTSATLKKKFKNKLLPKEDKSALYLHYFGNKNNDVTIGLKNDHYDYLFIDASSELQAKNKGLFQKLYSEFNNVQKEEMRKDNQSQSHDAGRTLVMNLPQEGLTLIFYNDDQKTLKSIVVRPKK